MRGSSGESMNCGEGEGGRERESEGEEGKRVRGGEGEGRGREEGEGGEREGREGTNIIGTQRISNVGSMKLNPEGSPLILHCLWDHSYHVMLFTTRVSNDKGITLPRLEPYPSFRTHIQPLALHTCTHQKTDMLSYTHRDAYTIFAEVTTYCRLHAIGQ